MTTRNADIYHGFWTSPRGQRVEVAIKEFKTPIPKDRTPSQEALTRKADLIFQTACGLEHLHSRTPPICHADIKPENVLINDWNGPAVSDFGLSRVLQDLEVRSGFTTSETIKGSVRYMARELFSGQKPSLKTDVYAFGGLILTVMSGKAPFDGLLDHVILRHVMQDEPPVPGDHPCLPAYDPLWKLMRRCWSSDPEARPTMQEVLQEASIHDGSMRHPDSFTDDEAGGYRSMDLVVPAAAFRGQAEPNIPILRTGRQLPHYPTQNSLIHYRNFEGESSREARLRSIWLKLRERRPTNRSKRAGTTDGPPKPLQYEDMTKERAESLQDIYLEELMRRASLDWEGFLTYADQKEDELRSNFYEQLDLDGNGHLDAVELAEALSKAGLRLTPAQLSDFMTCLTSTQDSHSISFPEFRDFFLLLPRKTSTVEMYRYYAVQRSLGNDGHRAAQINLEDDATLSTGERHPVTSPVKTLPENPVPPPHTSEHGSYDGNEKKELEDSDLHTSFLAMVMHSQAFNFLLAPGLAGMVSRTAIAPFDRLQVFLITSPVLPASDISASPKLKGVEALTRAISQIYSEAGMRSFWVGNGLNVLKIFPKRFMAKHVDQVDDVSKISGVSRFISGGIGGIISQFSVYPLETLKTQLMSSDGHIKHSLSSTLKRTWSLGGVPAFYRGLSVCPREMARRQGFLILEQISLVGVFPYSAIDISTFETLKILYIRSTGIQEPGFPALLAFGTLSGTVGATSLYPLYLVRTRLQAAGSPGHPQRYSGFRDVAHQTYKQLGWKGFYAGLLPTLAK
ncbi:hypothetical protein FRC00_010797, partial [Tulasnella sp. 408]